MEINKIHNMDCLAGLKLMEDKSVHCVVTSPPYWGLRDYGTAVWVGGDVSCDHKPSSTKNERGIKSSTLSGGKKSTGHKQEPFKNKCGHCGAKRIDLQLGLEPQPKDFIKKLVKILREAKRVLRDDGTLWLNIGDSYNGSGKAGKNPAYMGKHTTFGKLGKQETFGVPTKANGLKPKDLVGIPWMLAFALRDDGWYLRQDIIWSKPNPMPESVTDRCTKSHEYIFLLTKSAKYYYNQAAIMVDISMSTSNDNRLYDDQYEIGRPERGLPGKRSDQGSGMLKRKSWNGSTLDNGKTGLMKETNGGLRKSGNKQRKNGSERGCPEGTGSNVCSSVPWEGLKANKRSVWTVTTKPFTSAHFATFPEDLIIDCIKAGCPSEGIVLDPFMGAGTTALVAQKLNRNFIGFELNPKYIEMANKRLNSHLGMFSPENIKAISPQPIQLTIE